MAEKPVRSIPWIKYAYLKQMPSYDDALWIERKMTDTEAWLEFRSAFTLLIFLYHVMQYWLKRGRAWNSLSVMRKPGRDDIYIVKLEVLKDPNANRLMVRL